MGPRRRERGQATVDYVAVVVILAIALAVGAALVLRGADAPPRPPDALGRVLDPVTAPVANPDARVPDLGLRPGDEGGQPIGRAIGGIRAVVERTRRLAWVGVAAFGRGFGAGMWGTFRAFVTDPTALVRGGGALAGRLARDPLAVGAEQIRAAIAYARELRAMPAEAAYARFMRDLGELTADVAIARGQLLARRALLRALRRRVERLTPGPPPVPPPVSPPDRDGP